jgi:phosphatase NudJ
VFFFASLDGASADTDAIGEFKSEWIPLDDVPSLPLWPNELKSLAVAIAAEEGPDGVHSFVSVLEDVTVAARFVDW